MCEAITKRTRAAHYSFRRCSRPLLPYCAAAVLLTHLIDAQSDLGSITGFVKDPSGAIARTKESARPGTGVP
jgi:hypothetical protein